MKDTFSARRLLFPLIPLYRLALAFSRFRLRSGLEPVRRLRFPVVSVGNLSTGGSGKTPLTVALVKALARRGLRVDVLSRGYGRQSQLAAHVNPDGTAEEFGDEPLLIAREAGVPVYVAPERYNAGLLAEAEELPDGDELGAPSLRVLCARVGVYEPRPSVFLVPTGPAPQLPLLEPGKTQPSPSVRCMELAYPGAQ